VKIPLVEGKAVMKMQAKDESGTDKFGDRRDKSGTGTSEKIDFANFADDLKCIPTSQTSFIRDSEQNFSRRILSEISEIDFFTAPDGTFFHILNEWGNFPEPVGDGFS
jgi:hypothetical protein